MPTRRQMLQVFGVAALSGRLKAGEMIPNFARRTFGRTGRWISPIALGGQAGIQLPPPGVDPADIIVRAIELGINYLDTANGYDPSQANYGQAFRRLNLIPGQTGYNSSLREWLFINSKTGAFDAPNAIDEIKRSLSFLFGDGKRWFPDGAYLDSIQLHNLWNLDDVGQIYNEANGAYWGLLDYRDGTNRTGLNPQHQRLVRHLGVTGHENSPVLMAALQRDKADALDTLLVPMNPNDRRYCSHQFNVLPVARARGLGVLNMKVFSCGTIYTGRAGHAESPSDLVTSVGYPGGVDYSDLVRYSVSVPGVAASVIGVTTINRDAPESDQLAANLAAALIDATSDAERARIESIVAEMHADRANWFQKTIADLRQTQVPAVVQDSGRVVFKWDTAFAGADAIRFYQIWSGDSLVASLPFRPQTIADPLTTWLPAQDAGGGPFRIVAVTS